MLTNPPPSAGGILIARALQLLDELPAPPGPVELVSVMEQTHGLRTPEFLDGLDDPGFSSASSPAAPARSARRPTSP